MRQLVPKRLEKAEFANAINAINTSLITAP